ncbi:xylosyltransferase 2-like isoform X2 [Empidonax traillii]|uniref:xylosyltransferase 2-like isoform X2 n=1 Tax=Empidonax traillii TaxID=164674 RepID=UPI000FFD9995|nr:xylosyltransferase 2-like isoform X2 [Empidonax traillii]
MRGRSGIVSLPPRSELMGRDSASAAPALPPPAREAPLRHNMAGAAASQPAGGAAGWAPRGDRGWRAAGVVQNYLCLRCRDGNWW